jgi:beta-barrel assembly-enhancing protease
MPDTIRDARRWSGAIAIATILAIAGCAPTITTQQEVQMGAEYARQINQQLPLVQDVQANRYLDELGRSISRLADDRGLRYSFYIVDSDVINAFAVPGGHVYINRGLIERTSNMSELTGVLAHEIAHVTQRHGIEQMARAQRAEGMLSILYGVLLRRPPSPVEQIGVQVGAGAVFAGYSREAEREADYYAVRYSIQSGYDPRGLVTMLETLMAERQRDPGRVEQWFATHPTTDERIENTRQHIRDYGPLPANLTTNTAEYRNFQQRLRQLPPPRDRGQ